MPKKGGKKKAGGGKKKEDASEKSAEEQKFSALSQIRAMTERETLPNFVTLRMKLMNWDFLNFDLRVKTSTKLFQIKEELTSRHGRIKELKLCKDTFVEANELNDDMASLEELGFPGRPAGDKQEAQATVFYEYKACDHDDPLLLVWKR